MSTAPRVATVQSVTTDKGAEFTARRKAIGISVRALAERAGVDRATLTKVEAGEQVRQHFAVIGAVDKALSDLEREMGMDLPSQVETVRPIGDPEDGLVAFEISGPADLTVVVKGPVSNADELRKQVERLIATMAQRPKG